VGTLTQTDSGLIQQESTWASCPAWLTEVQDTPGRITYAGGKVTLSTSDPSQFAYLRTVALDKASAFVCRAKFTCAVNPYEAAMVTLSSAPTGAITLADDVCRSLFYTNTGSPFVRGCDDAYDTQDFSAAVDSSTEMMYEWVIGSTCGYKLRSLTDLSIIGQGSYANDLTYDPCWTIGDMFSAHHQGSWVISEMQMLDGLTATVTGILNGYHVDVTDPSDAVVAHATSTGTSVAVDISALQYPYSGKVKVYDTDGGDLKATYTGNLYGGWVGAYVGVIPPTVTAVTPAKGLNNSTVSITNIAGTLFAAGAGVKLKKTGESDIAASNVTVVSSSKITCDVNLTGAADGQWDVEVTNADTGAGTLATAFMIYDVADIHILGKVFTPPISCTLGNLASVEVDGFCQCFANLIGYTMATPAAQTAIFRKDGNRNAIEGLASSPILKTSTGEMSAVATADAVAGFFHVITGVALSSDKPGAVAVIKDGSTTVASITL
jgi:hypothetical protein